jgi:DNA-3-methyladenine glycosylase I
MKGKEVKRCAWCDLNSPEYVEYHDTQWGVPVYDDRLLFEMLSLEGMQAGLSWISILKKRQNYIAAFDNFEVRKIIDYGPERVAELLANPGIIRNRLKVNSIIKNAAVFISIQEEFGSFSRYIWAYVGHKQIQNSYENIKEIPVKNELSERITKDLKKRGMNFVGPVIIYSYMQAIGMINDHETTCFRFHEITN